MLGPELTTPRAGAQSCDAVSGPGLDADLQGTQQQAEEALCSLVALLPSCDAAELVAVRGERLRVVGVSGEHARYVGDVRARVIPPQAVLQAFRSPHLHSAGSAPPGWRPYWQAMASDGELRAFRCVTFEAVPPYEVGIVLHSRSRDPLADADPQLRELALAVAGSRLQTLLLSDQVQNLQVSLASSRRIGLALGIIVERLRVTDDVAFDLLKAASQRANVKLRDVAENIVLTGALPEGMG